MLDQINGDIKNAMKAKEKGRLEALRYLKAMLMENATAKKPAPEMDVVVKHAKKLRDSLENYPDGEMKEKIKKELEFISVYLPQQLSEKEVVAIIEEIKNSQDNPNMGSIMKELSPRIKGSFDGKKANQLVREVLS